MKLAEALSERADLQKRIAQIHSRLMLNSKVQEGESPAEDPQELFEELDHLEKLLQQRIIQINRTNCSASDGEKTLMELLAERDCLTQKIKIWREFLSDASYLVQRSAFSEIKIKSTVSVSAFQKQIDVMSKTLRELDTKIQELNWTTELL